MVKQYTVERDGVRIIGEFFEIAKIIRALDEEKESPENVLDRENWMHYSHERMGWVDTSEMPDEYLSNAIASNLRSYVRVDGLTGKLLAKVLREDEDMRHMILELAIRYETRDRE